MHVTAVIRALVNTETISGAHIQKMDRLLRERDFNILYMSVCILNFLFLRLSGCQFLYNVKLYISGISEADPG